MERQAGGNACVIMTIDPIYIPLAHMIGGRTDTCTVQYVIVHTGSLSGSSTKTTSGGSSECQRLVADGTRTISSRGGRPLLYRSISLRCLRRSLYLTYDVGMEATVDRKIFTVVDLVYVDVTSILARYPIFNSSMRACDMHDQTPNAQTFTGRRR